MNSTNISKRQIIYTPSFDFLISQLILSTKCDNIIKESEVLKLNDTYIHKRQIINGILLGLFFSADMIIKSISPIISFPNILVVYYLFLIAALLFMNKFRFNIKYIATYMLIVTLFAFSFLRVGDVSYTFQYFIYFSCFYIASSALQFKIDINKVFKTINFTNIFFALYLLLVVFRQYNQGILNIDHTMDLSYTALIGVSSFFLTFYLTNYKQTKKFVFANSIALLIELYFMIFISYNRGALVGLLVLFIFLFIRKFKRKSTRLFSLATIVAVGYFLYSNAFSILVFSRNYLASQGIQSNFINKTLLSLSLNTFDSGRGSLYSDAVHLFNSAPIFGNGIGHFASTHKGQYPHNLILEALADQGLFIAAVISIFCLICGYKFLLAKQSNLLILSILLFSIALPRLFMSSTIWMSPFFWSLVVIFITKPTLKKIHI